MNYTDKETACKQELIQLEQTGNLRGLPGIELDGKRKLMSASASSIQSRCVGFKTSLNIAIKKISRHATAVKPVVQAPKPA